MKKVLALITVIFVLSPNVFSQELTGVKPSKGKRDLKKINKILGDEFTIMPCKFVDPMTVADIVVDTANTYPDIILGQHLRDEFVNSNQWFYEENANYYVKNCMVSNQDYLEYKHWMLDSIRMEYLFRDGLYADEEMREFLTGYEKEIEIEGKVKKADQLYIETLREYAFLNMSKRKELNRSIYLPSLCQFFLSPFDQLNNRQEIDWRKVHYRYNYIDREKVNQWRPSPGEDMENTRSKYIYSVTVPVINNNYEWAQKSSMGEIFGPPDHEWTTGGGRDIYAVLAETYEDAYRFAPVIGLTQPQAEAFCNWKEVQINKQLADKGVNLLATVEIAGVNEISPDVYAIRVDGFDFTENWRITNAEFVQFQKAAKDSLWREWLYNSYKNNEYAAEMLDHEDYYFDYMNLEFMDFDPSNRDINLQLFEYKKGEPKHYDDEPYEVYLEKFEKWYMDRNGFQQNLTYTYVRNCISDRIKNIVMYLDEEEGFKFYQTVGFPNYYDEWMPRYDIIYDYPEDPIQSGVRLDSDYSKYHLEREILINVNEKNGRYLKIEEQPADESANISYEQAMAYYNWKFPLWKRPGDVLIQNYVLPNEEQFVRVQNGEQFKTQDEDLELPTPGFRYVVKFAPYPIAVGY